MRKTAIGMAVVGALFVCAAGAAASVINIELDPNAMLAGHQSFVTPPPADPRLAVTVQYAVYAPTMFDDTFATYGFTYAAGTENHYFYAYQVFNNNGEHPWPYSGERDNVRWVTVGLTTDTQAGNPGHIQTDPTQQDPLYQYVSAAGTYSAKWRFGSATGDDPPPLMYGSIGDVLYFSSPFGPAWMTATLQGFQSDTQLLPSPMPEPATLTILVVGFGGAWLMRRRSA